MLADPSNQGPITISYSQDPAELFELYPAAPFVLRPGATPQVFVLKADLGLIARGTFENTDPRYSRVFRYQHSPGGHCDDGDHADYHVDC